MEGKTGLVLRVPGPFSRVLASGIPFDPGHWCGDVAGVTLPPRMEDEASDL